LLSRKLRVQLTESQRQKLAVARKKLRIPLETKETLDRQLAANTCARRTVNVMVTAKMFHALIIPTYQLERLDIYIDMRFYVLAATPQMR
jgi:hypothetical protein